MPDGQEYWDPNEWEQHVFALLQDRHGTLNVHKIPARHKGDLGLDYYSLSAQAVYQCYAVQEPCEVSARADKQKSKITTDIKKFCKNKTKLKALFGSAIIDRWILVVPLHDSSQVNIHNTKKTIEVRACNLMYTSPSFEVMIQDLESFEYDSRAARAMQRRLVTVLHQPASPQQIDNWFDTSNTLVQRLEGKLAKRIMVAEPADLEAAVKEAVIWFLDRENALENLRLNAPELHEALTAVISRHQNRLKVFGPPSDGTPQQILRDELKELIGDLQASIPNFAAASAEHIARGTLVEWLMRCHLDFPPHHHA